MKNPFSKLIRISIILVSVVLLFNFFGYYLGHSKSTQNKELSEVKSISDRQQIVSQSIAKYSFLLLNNTLNTAQAAVYKDTLKQQIATFKEQQEQLKNQVEAAQLPVPQPVLRIRLLFSASESFYEHFAIVAREIVQADSAYININKKTYLNGILYNEQKFMPLMNDISKEYEVIAAEKNKEAFNIEIGKFISLIIEIVCLIILVLEPAFKKGEKGHIELQKAKNELLLEKKYLTSILHSQTN
jgi:hypothetical protein